MKMLKLLKLLLKIKPLNMNFYLEMLGYTDNKRMIELMLKQYQYNKLYYTLGLLIEQQLNYLILNKLSINNIDF